MAYKNIFCTLLAALSVWGLPDWAPAQPPERPLDITADSLEYLTDQKLMVGRGNVEIRDGDVFLRADYMSVQTVSRDVHAVGNVFYRSGTDTWQGEEFRYNIRTRRGDFGAFNAYYDPFYVTATESTRESEDQYRMKGVTLTTCDGDRPEFSIRAREASIEGNRIHMHGAVVYIADTVPIMYMPYFTRSLDTHERFFQWVPGYNSRLGAYLLSAYNYPIAGNVRGVTRLDYRTKRGFGVGQDFKWRNPERTYEGMIQGYYLKDDEPFKGPEIENREATVEEERYRLRLAHNQRLSDRDTVIVEANYLSDPFILKDFFRKEFRQSVQPENRATLTHRGDHYIAAMQLNKRLNDFYDNVDRLPELTLNLPRQQLLESDFFIESANAASYLDRVFPDGSSSEDYDSFRFDTDNVIHYPFRLGGFLNVIPRAGYRATYYSTTLSSKTVTNTFVVTPEEGPAYLTNDVKTVISDKGGDLRGIPQLGWEASFKAFRTWDDWIILGDGDGLRHVFEPYLDQTYLVEPNLLPGELPQFDSVDTLTERHDIKLGMRNKLQTRRNKTPVDVIDLNLYTFYRIEKQEGEEDFSDIFTDGRLGLHRHLQIEFDGSYDTYESELNTFNTRLIFTGDDASRYGLEHRYRRENQNLISAFVDLFPESRWSLSAGVRYNFEDSELEEQYYIVKRRGQCISWGIGVRDTLDNDDNEIEVWLQLWLTAFPNALIDLEY